jgi:hypothetical protein
VRLLFRAAGTSRPVSAKDSPRLRGSDTSSLGRMSRLTFTGDLKCCPHTAQPHDPTSGGAPSRSREFCVAATTQSPQGLLPARFLCATTRSLIRSKRTERPPEGRSHPSRPSPSLAGNVIQHRTARTRGPDNQRSRTRVTASRARGIVQDHGMLTHRAQKHARIMSGWLDNLEASVQLNVQLSLLCFAGVVAVPYPQHLAGLSGPLRTLRRREKTDHKIGGTYPYRVSTVLYGLPAASGRAPA